MWSIAHGSGAFTTHAGRSEVAATLFVAAGLGLIAAGLLLGARRRVVATLSVVAGFIWLAPAWEGWEGGSAVLRAGAMPVGANGVPRAVEPGRCRRDADDVADRTARRRRGRMRSSAHPRCCWRWCATRTSIPIVSPTAPPVSSSSVVETRTRRRGGDGERVVHDGRRGRVDRDLCVVVVAVPGEPPSSVPDPRRWCAPGGGDDHAVTVHPRPRVRGSGHRRSRGRVPRTMRRLVDHRRRSGLVRLLRAASAGQWRAL